MIIKDYKYHQRSDMKYLVNSLQSISLAIIVLCTTINASAQVPDAQPQVKQALPPIDLTTTPIREQFSSIENRTKIYENFRAVREDMFQKLKRNVNDSISALHARVAATNKQTAGLRSTIDSLNSNLNSTQANLDDMTRSKNSIRFLGMELEKGSYNSLMWAIIICLLLVLLIGFLIFQRNQRTVVNSRKDLDELKTEFEAYRKTSREAREKMALQHFNELKKLRGE